MRVFSTADMRLIEREAIGEGIPSLRLMENAAAALEHALTKHFRDIGGLDIYIFCGSGNNGGDGFALACRALASGADVKVIFIGSMSKITDDCSEMRRRYEEMGGEIVPEYDLYCADAAVDAIFGTGFHGELDGAALDAARRINGFSGYKLSADIPSGVASDGGIACENAVRADETVTFGFPKPSCLLLPGAAYCGRLTVADIGIPEKAAEKFEPLFGMTGEEEADVLIKRPRAVHKGRAGHALIIAGNARYSGAPFFAAQTAVISGAGLVTVATPESIHNVLAVKLNEAMAYPLPDRERLTYLSKSEILALASKANAVLVGPGLGRAGETAETIRDILLSVGVPEVVDADGINAMAGHINILRDMKDAVLTPHDAEFARLTGSMPPEGGIERVDAARELSLRTGAVIVLKGHRTVIASPDGRCDVNPTGNPGMARGGSGDVLAGLIVSLMAQRVAPYEAARAAVWLHGTAGDLCAKNIGEYGMTPTDLIRTIPKLLKKYDSINY